MRFDLDSTTKTGIRRLASGLAAIAVTVSLASYASAQEALVIDGEQIADAELFDAAKAEGSFTYYTVNFEEMERETLRRFEEDTGVGFEVVRLAGGRMYERIMTEFAGGQLQADLVSLSEPMLMQELIDKEILVPHKVQTFDVIPDNLKQADGYYYYQNRYAKLLGYNTTRFDGDTAPKSWADLTDPRFKDAVGIQEANSGGISWATVMFQREVVDPDYYTKLAVNNPKLYNGMTPISEDVVRGEIGVGEMTFGLARGMMEAGAPIGVTFPEEGMPAAAILAGVTSVAESPNAAKLYLNWVMSKHGGTIITQVFGDWASHPEVAPPDGSKYGLTLPASSELWMADPVKSETLKTDWIADWDAAYRKAN